MSTLSRLASCFLHELGRSVSRCGVRAVALLPRDSWYAVLWRISRVQAVLIWPILRFTPYRRDHRRSLPVAWMLNHWISQLVSVKGSFPIPIRIKGRELICPLFCDKAGTVLCSAHMPLLDACLQSLIELAYPLSVIAAPGALVESKFPVWGKPALPGLPSGPDVLLKVRTVLRNGRAVAALVDDIDSGAYSPNLFRVARLIRAKVLLFVAELHPNGDIEVEFFLPPDPSCLTEQSIFLNLRALESRVDRVFRRTPQSEKSIVAVSINSVGRDPPGCFADREA